MIDNWNIVFPRASNSYNRGEIVNRFLLGCVLVVGVSLLGCSKQPARNGSGNEIAKDDSGSKKTEADGSDSSNKDVVNVEPEEGDGLVVEKGKVNPEAVALFDAGIAAYQASNLPLAHEKFLAASRKGHADSQFNLGLMYEQGIGVGKNEKEAVVWYGKSAMQGNSAAQFNLGVLYENGRGTKVDFAKANAWYRKASVQGDPLAIGNLGMLYVRGDGVKVNRVAGVALLLMSATMDPSPGNNARRNITATRGLTAEMIGSAQSLTEVLSSADNLLLPLDRFLKESENRKTK
ncbi:sel1 repeat family protein [bacterium]|jgi:TPR repeat protein|nr:sel1 repeat family protein [bacterium]